MSSVPVEPVLLAILVGLLLGIVAWRALRLHDSRENVTSLGTRGDPLLGMLILAAFAMGAFLAYILLSLK